MGKDLRGRIPCLEGVGALGVLFLNPRDVGRNWRAHLEVGASSRLHRGEFGVN